MHPYYEEEYPILKELSVWFKQKSAEELTEIIISYIGESANEQSRWQLAMLNEQGGLVGADIKNMIDKALPEEGVWSWQEVSGYFEHTDNMLTADFSKGFDERNLRKMRQFYLAFPIRDALRTELS